MTSPPRPKAYSYIRFSTPEQHKGDSRGRQIEKAQKYADEHGLDLDTELSPADLGVSGYRGLNAKVGMLRAFLDAVRDGRVPTGSTLLIENMDRLTRDDISEALELFLGITNAGLTLVTITNGFSYSKESLRSEPYGMYVAIAELIRGNQESVRKGGLISDAYERKRKKALAGEVTDKPFTRMLPAWLTWDEMNCEYATRPDRAAVVADIFAKVDDGWGPDRIARHLNIQGYETWGGGKRKAARWYGSYIRKILMNTAVIGTFSPNLTVYNEDRKRRAKPQTPIEGMFPAVVDRDVYDRVRARMTTTAARGKNADRTPASIFAGVLRCARCGGTMGRISKGTYVYVACLTAHAKAKGCEYLAVPYKDVEEALTVNAKAIIEDAPRGHEPEGFERQKAGLEDHVSELAGVAREFADEWAKTKNEAARRQWRRAERELNEAQESLRDFMARRDTLAAPFVLKRLKAVEASLRREPLDVATANKALREAVTKIVCDPEEGQLTIYWQHSEEPTEGIPFFTKHRKGFD